MKRKTLNDLALRLPKKQKTAEMMNDYSAEHLIESLRDIMTLESDNLFQRIRNTDSKLRETTQNIVSELEIGSKSVQDNIAETFEHVGDVQAELLHTLGQEYQKYQVESSASIEQLKKSDLALNKVTTEFEKDIASLLSKHAHEREALLRDVKNAVSILENDIDTLKRSSARKFSISDQLKNYFK